MLSTLCVIAMGQGQCGRPPAQITIQTPANGTFLDQTMVTVEGNTSFFTPQMVVTVNGVPASLVSLPGGGGFWTASVPLDAGTVLNPIEAVLTAASSGAFIDNARIMIIVGDSIADGALSPEALALRLNDSGLDVIEPTVASLVDFDIASFISPGQVLISDFCAIDGGFLGCLGSVDVVAANPPPSISGFSIDADSQDTFLDGVTTVTDLRVDVDINGSGLAPDCGLRITSDITDIDGDFDIQPAGGSIDVNLLGAIDVSFTGFDDEFTSGLCDFPIIGDLIQLIIGDVSGLVESGFENELGDPDGAGPLDSPIADGVEEALSGIDLGGAVGDELGVMLETPGIPPPDDGESEDVDGLTLAADVRVTSEDGPGAGQCVIPAGAPDLPASYHVSEAFPPFGPTAPGGATYGLGMCISSSAFNQLLKAQVECGLLRAELTELGPGQPITAGLLALPISAFQILPANTPITIRLTPTVAPIVTGNPGPSGELAELLIGQLLVDFVRDAAGVEIVELRLAADAKLGFDLTFDPGTGALVASLGEPPAQDITLVIVDNRINASQNQVQNFLPQIFAPLLPELGSALGAIPLPYFLGVDLNVVEVTKNGQFMSVFFDLSVTP